MKTTLYKIRRKKEGEETRTEEQESRSEKRTKMRLEGK